MVALLLAIAAGFAAPAKPDTARGAVTPPGAAAPERDTTSSVPTPDSSRAALPYELRRVGGIDRLSPPGAGAVELGGVALDAFGRVYVSDQAGRRLLCFDGSGRPLAESGSLGDDPVRFRRPGAVAPAGALAMAVLDELNQRILVYDLFGHFQGVWASLDSADSRTGSGTTTPVALASDRSGALYVADASQDRVLVFDPRGALARIVSGHGSGSGSFHGLAGLAVGRRGDLVVSEGAAGRIQRLDPGGAVRRTWMLPRRPSGTRLPLAVDDSLRVAVADPRAGVLWVFDSQGRVLAMVESLEEPVALFFHRDGALWVAERGARRVSRYLMAPAARRTGG